MLSKQALSVTLCPPFPLNVKTHSWIIATTSQERPVHCLETVRSDPTKSVLADPSFPYLIKTPMLGSQVGVSSDCDHHSWYLGTWNSLPYRSESHLFDKENKTPGSANSSWGSSFTQ